MLFAFVCVIALVGVVHADFNFFRKAITFPLDENSRLKSNWLVYSNNPSCHNFANNLWNSNSQNANRKLASVDAPVSVSIFGSRASETDACFLACLDKGASVSYMTYVFPEKIFDRNGDEDAAEWLGRECQSAEVGFISYLPLPASVSLYWISPRGERHLTGTVTYGEKGIVWQHTTLGHRFEAVNEATQEVVGTYNVENSGCHFIGGRGGSRVRHMNATLEIKNVLSFEIDRALGVKRTFTELGFSRSRLPPDLWASMQAYYYNNRDNYVREEWDSKGLYVNWWERDAYIINMPWDLKRYWQRRLQDLVEEWIGGVELEMTDIYGMRRYENGARLLTHVDRTSTHATSLIINIAQENMREPWAVEIYDFAGRLHLVTMEEGDIVYYESARCMHGRMSPLQGDFYVNLFSHYRPKGDPEWHLKPNPPDATPPLLDIGDCVASAGGLDCSGASKDRIPFLSRGQEKVVSRNDLFEYWKKVSPPERLAGSARGEL